MVNPMPQTRILHYGTSYAGIRYVTDNVDSFPGDIRNYEHKTWENFSWLEMYEEIKELEKLGFKFNVQIGDMFYETKED
jgi:hypothetical protein